MNSECNHAQAGQVVNAGFLSTDCLFLFIHDSGRLTAEVKSEKKQKKGDAEFSISLH